MDLVVLDVASVETHFLVQPLSWLAPESHGAIWCPLPSPPRPLDRDRDVARRCAEVLELPLVWPERHHAPVPRAMRLAALAGARGHGAAVTFSLARVAFGAGADLDRLHQGAGLDEFAADGTGEVFLQRIEQLTGLTAAQAKLVAEAGSEWDAALSLLATELAEIGITQAPALRLGERTHLGSLQIRSLLMESPGTQSLAELRQLDDVLSTLAPTACSPG